MPSPDRWLDEVIQIGGVRGAAVVVADDGLVVREAAMEGVSAADAAALMSAVVRRTGQVLTATGGSAVRMVTLAATHGAVVAVQGQHDLWLIAITEPSAELGRLRLLLGDLAPDLT
jgi:predicted regulator of Ras-like GTPase activity (Roadblock/LC7/MglB family)